jgi:peroxiredoxin Q/BCP
MLGEGDKAPDVTLQLSDGNETHLSALRGDKAMVLYFYPKDDTTGCTAEAQAFTALARDFAKAGVIILGISKDSPKKHQNFIKKYDLRIDLATDADGAVCEAFGVWVEKSLYGRKYMGIDRSTFLIGADGRIAKIWRKVKVPGHADQVLAAAKAL